MSDTPKLCSIEGCGKPARKRGWCQRHYYRWKQNGDPQKVSTTSRLQTRAFFDSVLAGTAPREPNGCVLWPFGVQRDGYPVIRDTRDPDRRKRKVGRLVLEHFVGPPPTSEHQMGHAPHVVCGHRHCVAPEHLSWQTPAEQGESKRKDGSHPLKTHCIRGHEFTPENTVMARRSNGTPQRVCRECRRIFSARAKAKRKERQQ